MALICYCCIRPYSNTEQQKNDRLFDELFGPHFDDEVPEECNIPWDEFKNGYIEIASYIGPNIVTGDPEASGVWLDTKWGINYDLLTFVLEYLRLEHDVPDADLMVSYHIEGNHLAGYGLWGSYEQGHGWSGLVEYHEYELDEMMKNDPDSFETDDDVSDWLFKTADSHFRTQLTSS